MRGHGQDDVPGEATAELIARARHDRAAFGELYDLYLPRVYGFCRKYSYTREEAEDLTAETFQRALAAIGRYEDRDVPLSRWLLRIAHNVIVNQGRRAGRTTLLGDSASLLSDESDVDDWEEAHWLRMHIQALPEDQQEVVRLRFYEDQSFRDVAARMGRSEGAVKQLLRRALRALHLRIEQEAEERVALE
jgi:RNA polymerase sigma-70 factor (ECF subfamily)